MQWHRFARLGLACLISSCFGEPLPGGAAPPLSDRAAAGLESAPVSLHLAGLDPSVIGLGSYLVNAASGCVDCHGCPTYAPGQSPFKGGTGQLSSQHYLGGGAPFGQGLVAPGIAPDPQGKPGGLTRAQFFAAMRTGADPGDSTRVLQHMPWALYRHLTDEDLDAMYDYLRVVPPATPGTCAGPGE